MLFYDFVKSWLLLQSPSCTI